MSRGNELIRWDLRRHTEATPIEACALHQSGRRRVVQGSGWVGTPKRAHHTLGGSIMKWTKPEAEVVAVTMEVTAYVATL